MKESDIMKIHYITGIAALFVVAVHIMMRLVMPYELSLEYENVIANYHNLLIAIHGFNGLRVILLEMRQSRSWESMVTVVTIAAMMGVIAYGTRTIIVANGLSLG
jgi:succinate dehydrogenase / fumarate reductase membrane anchor subunit